MKQKTKFKKTEIGKIPEDWEVITLSEAVLINPKRELKKGSNAKKVSMGCLNPFNKKIQNSNISKFSGGSKFVNGDTLIARITPCLENGKTAFVDILNDNEIGFGSTEFIVLSGKDGKIINDYVYYLSISPQLRREAIKSMTGTSGRQRVQTDLFGEIEIAIPNINEQSAIASILSSLDSKIELNQQMNKTLEAIGQAIFKRWFVDFEFPDKNGKPYKSSGGKMVDSELGEVPEGWGIRRFADLVFNVKEPLKPGEEICDRKYVPIESLPMKRMGMIDYKSHLEAQSSLIAFEKDDILFGAMRAYFHRVNFAPFKGVTRTTAFVLRPHKRTYLSFALFLLNMDSSVHYANLHSKGSTMPYAVWDNSLSEMPVVLPTDELLASFHVLVYPFLQVISGVSEENIKLSKIRDSLLPRLMSGKIRVPVEVRI